MDKAKSIIVNILEDKKATLAGCKEEINDLVKRLAIKNTSKEILEAEIEQLENTLTIIKPYMPVSATVGLSKAGCKEY